MSGNPVRSLAVLLFGIINLVILSGCGGGGGNVVTPPPMGNFTNGNLKGNYVFSYQGSDAFGVPFVAAGQFSANGSGMITGGAIDLNDEVDGVIVQAGAIAGTSTYSVAADGETSVILNVPTSSIPTFTLQMTLASSTHGVLSTFDTSFSGSGTIDMQAAGAAVPTNLAFVLSGVDLVTFNEALFGGNLSVNAGTTIITTSSVGDILAPGLSLVDTADTTLSGTVTLDSNNPGRGVLMLASANATDTFNFAFYIIDGTHMKLAEISDTQAAFLLGGDGFAAPGTPNQQLVKGNYAYVVSGETNFQTAIAFAAGGIFTTDGNGKITGGVQDLQSTKLAAGQTLAATTYTSDPNFARIVLTLTDSNPTTFQYALYPTSENSVLMVEIDAAVNGDCECFASGIGYQQTSTAAPSGSFALNVTGATVKHGQPQDVVGQIAVSGTTVTGTLNIVNLTVKPQLNPNIPLSSSTISATDSLGHGNALTLNSADLGSASYGLSFYTVDGKRVLLMETDDKRVSTGLALQQTN